MPLHNYRTHHPVRNIKIIWWLFRTKCRINVATNNPKFSQDAMCSQLKTLYCIRCTYKPLIAGTSALLLAFLTVLPQSAFAQPPPGMQLPGRPYMGYLPPAHEIIYIGAAMFLFLDGIFFRKALEGYVVTPAPIGAHIPEIPANVVPLTIDGTHYYTYNGVYYQKLPDGYAVVPQSVKASTPASIKRARIRVAVTMLNVRSGPGPGYPVICNVSEGQLLDVQSSELDWAYVKLSDNTYGWVKIKYTQSGEHAPMG